MASNRVNIGSFVNPLESLQKSVSDLSTGYARQVEADKERLRLNKAAEESKRRYEADKAYRAERDAKADAAAKVIADRQAVLAGRQDKEYETKQAMTDWYKNFDYNIDDVATAKAKSVFGLTDEQLSSPKGKEALSIIKDNALYSEDIANFYANQFAKKFGTAIDASLIAPKFSNVSSLASLQASEDSRAKMLADLYEKGLTARTTAAKELYSPTDGKSGSSSSKGSGGVKTFADIKLQDKAKAFEGNWWWLPKDSDKQNAIQVAQDTLDTVRKTNPDITPAEADRVIDYVLDRASTPDTWDGIDDSDALIAKLITEGVADARVARTGNVRNQTAQKYLEGVVSGEFLKSISPTNIRTSRRETTQKLLDELYARTAAAAEAAGTPVTPRTSAIANTGNVETDILNTTGIGPNGQVSVNAPDAAPKYAPKGTPFMGNQSISSAARAALDAGIIDPNVMVNSPAGRRQQWLVNQIPGYIDSINSFVRPNGERTYNADVWENIDPMALSEAGVPTESEIKSYLDSVVRPNGAPVDTGAFDAAGNPMIPSEAGIPNPADARRTIPLPVPKNLGPGITDNQRAAALNKAAATLISQMPPDRLQLLLSKGDLKPELKDRILKLLAAQ